ncbi:MAG: hypothetical protein MHM6MM_004344 [Cercozoa sp. M6MM]
MVSASHVIFVVLTSLATVGVALAMWRKFSQPRMNPLVALVVLVSWVASFSIVFALPLDIVVERDRHDTRSALEGIVATVYYSAMVFTWLVIPFMQGYAMSGHFSPAAKAKDSLRFNLIFYGVIGLLAIGAVLYLGLSKATSWDNMVPYLMSLANTWGLLMMVLLLGYGLIEVPRGLWHKGHAKRRLQLLYYRIGLKAEDKAEARERLRDCQRMVNRAADRASSDLSPYISRIQLRLDLAKDSSEKRTRRPHVFDSKLSDRIDRADVDVDLLADLHVRVRADVLQSARCEEEVRNTLDEITLLEATEADEHHKKKRIRTALFRIGAVLCALMSLIVLWCEATLAAPVLSPLRAFFKALGTDATLWFTTLPLGYVMLCALYSLRRLRIAELYYMHAHKGTDANSLLLNAGYTLRVVFPLGFNFLLMMLDDVDASDRSAFVNVVGKYRTIPLLGQLDIWLPLVTLLFCAATFFNVFGRLLRALKVTQFVYSNNDEDARRSSDRLVADGKLVVRRLRARQRVGRAQGEISDRDFSRRERQLQREALVPTRPQNDAAPTATRPMQRFTDADDYDFSMDGLI